VASATATARFSSTTAERLVGVERGDRRLHDVRPAAAQRERTMQQLAPFGDLLRVPQRAVLLVEQHELAVAQARVAPCVVQEHQREQCLRLGLVRHQRREGASEPDRLGGEVAAAAVALVEDQVDDGEHRGQAVGQQVRRRDAERDARRLDLALRAHEPLRHGRVGHEESARDLLRRQAAERAQRERDLRVERERRMAAREDQLEPLVGEGRLVVHRVLHCFGDGQEPRLRSERPVAADPVDRPVAGRCHEPGARVVGQAVARPPFGRDRERLLRGFLGEVEVAEEADQRGEDAAPLLPEDLLRQRSTNGRTSTAPVRAPGMRPATSIAASRSSASKRKKPPSASFVSAYGPSVVSVSPFWTRTVVAVSAAWSSAPPTIPAVSDTAMYSPCTDCCSSSERLSNSPPFE
jgi:hypothetical protein